MVKNRLEKIIAELRERIMPNDPFEEIRDKELLQDKELYGFGETPVSTAQISTLSSEKEIRIPQTWGETQLDTNVREQKRRPTKSQEMIVGSSSENAVPFEEDSILKSSKKSDRAGRFNKLENILVSPLKALRLRNKMIAVALPPLLVVAVIAMLGVEERWDSRGVALNSNELMEYATVNADLADHLRAESIYSTAYLAEGGDLWGDELEQTRALTDSSVQRFLALVDSSEVVKNNALLEGLNKSFIERLDNLNINRTAITNRQIPVTQAVSQYGATLDASSRINSGITQSLTIPALAETMNNVTSLARLENAISWEASILVAAIEQEGFFTRSGEICENVFALECVSFQDAQVRNAETQSARSSFDIIAFAADDRQNLRDLEASQEYENFATQIYTAARSNAPIQASFPTAVGNTAGGTFIEAALSQLTLLNGIEKDFLVSGAAIANETLASATRTIILFTGGTAIIAVLALALAVLAARATVRPINELTFAAQTLATEQLPDLVSSLRNPNAKTLEDATFIEKTERTRQELEKISIESGGEVGELADAFNSIQRVTVEVAQAQNQLLQKGIGDIFVHLARRNQVLLDRQIASIEAMEQGEEDPDQLANLFTLDHLATRMRRNAESLLVLAGAETVRSRTGKPVVISDIIRLGMGEVENFQRVRMTEIDQVLIPANIARDLAHMLGELIENATQFSPPESFVDIQGKKNGNGTYYITITDHGVGMNSEQLTSANNLLANPPSIGLKISRSLGFIVVSRLAARFGVHVSLSGNPRGGVVATVMLPASALYQDANKNVPTEAPPVSTQSAESQTAYASPQVVPEEKTLPIQRTPSPVEAKPSVSYTSPQQEVTAPPAVPSLKDLPQPTSQPVVPKMVPSSVVLPKRQPTSRKADLPPPSGRPFRPAGQDVESRATSTKRKPEEIQDMLSRFRSGTINAKESKPLETPKVPDVKAERQQTPVVSGEEKPSSTGITQETVAKKAATRRPASKSSARKTPVKKAPARKAPAKKAPARKVAANRSPARKEVPQDVVVVEDESTTVDVASMPPPTAPTPVRGSVASKPLTKREPKSRTRKPGVERSAAVSRSPEEVREALLQYRAGLQRDS